MRSDKGNVIPLCRQSTAEAQVSRAALLAQVEELILRQLQGNWQRLVDNADDLLFELAERTAPGGERNALFEAMRDLRFYWKALSSRFLDRVGIQAPAWEGVLESESTASSATPGNRISALLSQRVEALVAVATQRHASALEQLNRRFYSQCANPPPAARNPLAPARLCEAFVEACKHAGMRERVTLILLGLFERFFLNELDLLYVQLNRQLAAAGILPELPVSDAPQVMPSDDPATLSEALAQSRPVDNTSVLDRLRALLIDVDGLNAGSQLLSRDELLALLDDLQGRPLDADLLRTDLPLRERLLLAGGWGDKSRDLGRLERDLVDLVDEWGMALMDDATLPAQLKTLLSMLRLPLLKALLLDPALFDAREHPLRSLVDAIGGLAVGWSGDDDPLFRKAEQLVHSLLSDYQRDPQPFAEALLDFTAFEAEERHLSEMLEHRTRAAEEGRTRAVQARQAVEAALNERLLGRPVPALVVQLVSVTWSQVMLMNYLKHGPDSTEWHASLNIVDELLWSVSVHTDPLERLALLERVPSLLKALREGLAMAAFNPLAASEYFARLEDLHVQSLQAGGPDQSDWIVLSEPVQLDISGTLGRLDEPAPANLPPLRVGQWFERAEKGESLHCKLSVIPEGAGRYVFVDRRGIKVLEISGAELAGRMRIGKLLPLDERPLFSRILLRVGRRLSGQRSA